MQVVGFNLTKISANKKENTKPKSLNINIEFPDIQKDKIEMLKDSEALKISFKFLVEYLESEKKKDIIADLDFRGIIMLSVSKEESKDITKAWKKKELPNNLRISLSNLVLKKTASKALTLQDELNLPSHISVRQVRKG